MHPPLKSDRQILLFRGEEEKQFLYNCSFPSGKRVVVTNLLNPKVALFFLAFPASIYCACARRRGPADGGARPLI
jgi:hypothetical protein